MGTIAKFFCRPIGWPTHVLTCLACASLCWGARLPGGQLLYIAVGLLLMGCLVLVWLVRLVLWLVPRKLPPLSPRFSWKACVPWCAIAAFLSVTGLAIAFNVPFQLSFRISRPALDRLAQSVLSDGIERKKHWAGVIPVSRARLMDGRIEMEFDKHEFPWGRRGLYFNPTGLPVKTSEYPDQQWIEGGWYQWHNGSW